MRKKRGFTLIELLAVITILAIILLVVVPSALKSYDNSKKNLYDIMIKNICYSSNSYYEEFQAGIIEVKDENKETITKLEKINIADLQKKNYLDKDLINPITGKEIGSSNVEITVSEENNNVDFYVTIDGNTKKCSEMNK